MSRKKSKMNGKKDNEIFVHPSTDVLAIAEARAFANIAKNVASNTSIDSDPGEYLAYLVNAGLAIELYLKAIMIAGRNGKVTLGHDLTKLYDELPAFLSDPLEDCYSTIRKQKIGEIKITALTLRQDTLPLPEGKVKVPNYATFKEAINSLRNEFTHARYFFERVNSEDWGTFYYPPHVFEALVFALDGAYEHYKKGGFG